MKRTRQPGILEVDKETPLAIEPVAVDQLPQERRLPRPANPLHDEGEIRPELDRQPNRPRH